MIYNKASPAVHPLILQSAPKVNGGKASTMLPAAAIGGQFPYG
jgi:hypothetical protein